MKYPDDMDKKSWDIMVGYAQNWKWIVRMLFFLAVIGIVFMMIKDVV